MPDETPAKETQKPDEKAMAIQAYYDAPARKAKGEMVKKYPFLSQIFSGANHD